MKNKTKLNKGFRALALPIVALTLNIQAQELEEVVVSGSFIPDEKRDTAEINVVLDSSDTVSYTHLTLPTICSV